MSPLESCLHELVIANRILAHEGVVDGFGHVSIRHPERPDRFFLSCSRSPQLVTLDDLMEFDLDCRPIDQRGRIMYNERPIHGGLYRARTDVAAVVHNHAYELIPFSVTDVRLRPLLHLAGPIGSDIPVWDIGAKFGETDMLVRNLDHAADLAACLGRNSVALMRGHGAAVVGGSLREAVYRAVYLMVNARMQMQAMQFARPIRFLTPDEIEKTSAMVATPVSLDRAWENWVQRSGGA